MRAIPLRRNTDGVASTVATLFSLLVFLVFLQIAVFAPIPDKQYQAEWSTSREALSAFQLTRSILAGPVDVGTTFSVPIPIGTNSVSPLALPSPGLLKFDTTQPGPNIGFRYVPDFLRSEVGRIDQDVILAIDSSGSMSWNDPTGLRIKSAKEYVDQLRCPDRIAIVDFDSVAYLTPRNVGAAYPPHHLNSPGHDCVPTHEEVKADLDTFVCPGRGCQGATNSGLALKTANDELATYGDHRNQWVIILLTDGINCCPQPNAAMNNMAIAESLRAAGMGTVIYTIGLRGRDPVDAANLTRIAENTGGSYYQANSPEEIRWIYQEIAHRYTSAFICSQYSTIDGTAGSLQLTLGSREYPSQTLRLENGALSTSQGDGSQLRSGLPFEYLQVDPSSGAFGITLMTFIGKDVEAVGTGHEILRATVVGRDRVAQIVHKINLTEEADSMQAVAESLWNWTLEGAATPVGALAVQNHTSLAQIATLNAHANYTLGSVSAAKVEVERAQIYLADALDEIDVQVANRQIQGWLGASTKDDIRVIACRLDQWLNWYDGLTFTIDSPAAASWAQWFETTLRAAGARVSVGLVGMTATLTLHTINEYVIDHRFVEMSFGL